MPAVRRTSAFEHALGRACEQMIAVQPKVGNDFAAAAVRAFISRPDSCADADIFFVVGRLRKGLGSEASDEAGGKKQGLAQRKTVGYGRQVANLRVKARSCNGSRHSMATDCN